MKDASNTGAMGLPYAVAGQVVQALAHVIVDREDHTFEDVQAALAADAFDEGGFWDLIAEVINELDYVLFGQHDH